MRLPKTVQATSSHATQTQADSLAASEVLNALFVGGSLTQTVWQIGGKDSAYVGRLDVDSSSWAWQRHFIAPGDTMHTITALALDDGGTKLACYGYDSPLVDDTSRVGFLFVLDPATGATVSGVMRLDMVSDGYRVTSAGFLVESDGGVYMAFNQFMPTVVTVEQTPFLAKWDSTTNTMTYFKRGYKDAVQLYYSSVTASLAKGSGTLAN